MNKEFHASISEMLLDTAALLAQSPRTALAAGDLIWGATFHACCAADQSADASHRHPRTRRQLKEIINLLTIERETRKNFADAVDDPVRRLHDNFYSGHLNDAELADDILMATSFVRQLLQIAQRT